MSDGVRLLTGGWKVGARLGLLLADAACFIRANRHFLVYRRIGLAIWPEMFNGAIENRESFSKWAMGQIEQTTSAKATPLEKRLVRYLFTCAQDRSLHSSTVASLICNAAISWKNVNLWRKGVEVSSGDYNTTLIDVPGAFKAFGFDSVRAE